MPKQTPAPQHGLSRLTDWDSAAQQVQTWFTLKNQPETAPAKINFARERAATLVYNAMLRDAVGMVALRADNERPQALRRNPRPMAEAVVSSILTGKRFTSLIATHDPEKDASLRTWLTMRIHWKIYTHLRREQYAHLHELVLPLLGNETDMLEKRIDETASHESAEECAAQDEEVRHGLHIFEQVLTEREQAVLVCYFDGASNNEGAQELGMTLPTYKRAKQAGLEKLRMAGSLKLANPAKPDSGRNGQ